MKALLMIAFLFTIVFVNAQDILKLRADKFKFGDVKGQLSEWIDCDVLVVWNGEIHRISIYSKETQEYDVIRGGEENFLNESDNSTQVFYKCIDKNGLKCDFIFIKKDGDISGIVIQYKNKTLAYSVKEI